MSTTLARILGAGLAGEGCFSSWLAHPLFLGWAAPRGWRVGALFYHNLEEGYGIGSLRNRVSYGRLCNFGLKVADRLALCLPSEEKLEGKRLTILEYLFF